MSVTSPRLLPDPDEEVGPPRCLLATIVPPGVEVEERFGEPTGGALFEEEERVVARATDRRRREYATVRCCARLCLQRLGHPPAPIVPGVAGAPTWPCGVRGSLTHCTGYAAAAVAPKEIVSAIGIDAEPDAPLPEGVLELVATPAERDLLAGTQRLGSGLCWDRLLFSAKESVYKAWCPAVHSWLDPLETEIVFHPDRAEFTAVVARARMQARGSSAARLHGRWVRHGGILITATALRR